MAKCLPYQLTEPSKKTGKRYFISMVNPVKDIIIGADGEPEVVLFESVDKFLDNRKVSNIATPSYDEASKQYFCEVID